VKHSSHFFILSRSVLHRMRNRADKSCRENQIARFMFSDSFSKIEIYVYEIMWKNII